MVDLSDPNLFWLNVTNITLGIATLVCCGTVGYEVIREILAHIRTSRSTSITADDHSFQAPDIGITMADGGKKTNDASPMSGMGKPSA